MDADPDCSHLAAGYQDGSIRIFDLKTSECTITFQGHKSSITCLTHDQEGVRLVSGSKDTEIVVWDLVNEAGMFRLRGHKGAVTQCRFLLNAEHNVLVSTSKDTFVKFWDLNIQHCFKTLIGHRSEVQDFVVAKQGNHIVTGTSDVQLSIYDVIFKRNEKNNELMSEQTEMGLKQVKDSESQDEKEDEEEEDDINAILTCSKLGSLTRQGKDRISSMRVDPSGTFLACHGISPTLEWFRFSSDEEIEKILTKRRRKLKKKLVEGGQDVEGTFLAVKPLPKDIAKPLGVIKASAKIKSFDFFIENDSKIKVALLLANNSIEVYTLVSTNNGPFESTFGTKMTVPGHRTDVRTLCFSSDNTAILSASNECIKIWNRQTCRCIRTMSSEYSLCSTFVPGDRHCIVGTKSGKVQIFDIASNTLLETVDAHQGAVWSLILMPDNRGLITGSADQEVRFWDFELMVDPEYSQTSKRLTLIHSRTLKVPEDVLCVRISQDGRLLAVSLLDSTVKIFFVDTFKFFLSLYGHKFPVLCMDMSDDCTLIATGSADRNVKIWGLDFGDCHKSIFAHDDSVMCLQFIPKTHMFFTGGKDGLIKQWDADNFEKITILKGHHNEVWALAISPNGKYVVSASHDKSMRLWEKTEEILVLEEEREQERETEFEKSLSSGEQIVIPGEVNGEVGMASKKTVETLKAAEKLMESVDIYKEETEKLKEYKLECEKLKRKLPVPPSHPLMVAYNCPTQLHFVLHVLKQIKSSELEEALLVLPFSYVIDLLTILNELLEKGWNVELSCRCLFFLLRVHHGEITSNEVLLTVFDRLRISAVESVKTLRDTAGFNMAGLSFLQHEIESQEEVQLFIDATQNFIDKKRKRKRKERLAQRAILALH